MKSTKRINTVENVSGFGTAAPNFHLSDSLDWSCFSARIKNQIVVVPRYISYDRSGRDRDDAMGNTAIDTTKGVER